MDEIDSKKDMVKQFIQKQQKMRNSISYEKPSKLRNFFNRNLLQEQNKNLSSSLLNKTFDNFNSKERLRTIQVNEKPEANRHESEKLKENLMQTIKVFRQSIKDNAYNKPPAQRKYTFQKSVQQFRSTLHGFGLDLS